MTKKAVTPNARVVPEEQAVKLHRCIATLIREFKLEPGMLAGSVYANLHANDIALFEVLGEPRSWSVRAVADELSAPMTTVSSALDRLERSGLIARKRTQADRRVVLIELTSAGQRMFARLREAHVKNCRAMLARLSASEAEEFLRLSLRIAQ